MPITNVVRPARSYVQRCSWCKPTVHIITQMGHLPFTDSPTFMDGVNPLCIYSASSMKKCLICHEGPVNIGYWLRSCVNKGAVATGGWHPIVGNFTPKLSGGDRSFCLLLLI